MYRNTYVEVDLNNIKYNVSSLVKKYSGYKYYFGVVKARCYGHGDIEVVRSIIDGGCNYLAVATLDEAIVIRNEISDIPILCLGIINIKYLSICKEKNITVTISNLDYLKSINDDVSGLRVHIKINTGMNRLGVNNSNDFNEICSIINDKNIILEGIYTHIYNPDDREATLSQFSVFEDITHDINLKSIPIVHVGASDATEFFTKRGYANGCRLGISMYGLVNYRDIEFKSTYRLCSEVIQINEVDHGIVGYNGYHKVNDRERIAVISIGYADGIIRKNTGRYVYINDKRYKIVGSVCMDMLFVKVDDDVKVGDKVYIMKDIEHIKEIAKYLDTIPYEVICSISDRVPRMYIDK